MLPLKTRLEIEESCRKLTEVMVFVCMKDHLKDWREFPKINAEACAKRFKYQGKEESEYAATCGWDKAVWFIESIGR